MCHMASFLGSTPVLEVLLLVECWALWGKHERVHVQNMEQLHAHDCYQNVTEHNYLYMKQNLQT